jgi:hypothetical protein
MQLHILKDTFSKEEAIGLLTKIVPVKVKRHESKILKSYNKEAISMRERWTKQPQRDIYEAKQAVVSNGKNSQLNPESKNQSKTKNQFISFSFFLLGITALVVSLSTNDIPMAELSKGLAVIFLLLTLKYL